MITHKSPVIPGFMTAVLALLFFLSLAFLLYGNYMAGSTTWNMVFSGLLLSVPLALLYFSIGLLVAAGRQRRSLGVISGRLAAVLYWTPRIAGVLIILFVALFALDVFSEKASFWELLLGFVMHSLPAIIMAVVLALAWRRPWLGFGVFLFAAIYFLRFFIGGFPQDLGILLLFSGPMAAIALLFWANWKWQKEIRLP